MTTLPVSPIGIPAAVGIDHRVHRRVLVQFDGHHGIECQSGGVDSDPAASFLAAHGLADERKKPTVRACRRASSLMRTVSHLPDSRPRPGRRESRYTIA
jgi:hypothetical protein